MIPRLFFPVGIASVFSGGAAGGVSLGAGLGMGPADRGIGSRSVGGAARISPSNRLRRGSLLSGERAVFKPVVNRIDSLELQVSDRNRCRLSLFVCVFVVVLARSGLGQNRSKRTFFGGGLAWRPL